MAPHNVVFAIDVDYRSENHNFSKFKYQNYLKQWISRCLLTLGSKYGFEKVRWGYTFFHSRTVRNGSIITRGTDFKELHEKDFSDFEEELIAKFADSEKTPYEQRKVQHTQASCVQNTLKEILLDFQWDRPDITSPTKLTLRPRRSIRNNKNISLADDELSYLGRNVLFVVSDCPHSKRDLEEFLLLRSIDGKTYKDLLELVLPKRLMDILIQRNVVLHWADSNSLKVNNEVEDHMGLRTIMEALQLVAGKLVPLLTPCLGLNHIYHDLRAVNEEAVCAFPTGSTTGYILTSEKTYQRAFPALVGTLCWGADEDKHTCSLSFEPVSCRQTLCAPVEVVARGVLQDLDTDSFRQLASECWVILCPDKPEKDQVSFQCLLKELSNQASSLLAEVTEGGRVHSAVLSVLSPHTALLTLLQPPVTWSEEVVDMIPTSSQAAHDLMDLPDVVSSVLNVMYDIMKDDESSEQTDQHEIPDWVNQELRHRTNPTTDFTEGWFPLSDDSGISCHSMESMRILLASPAEEEQREFSAGLELTHSLAEFYQNNTAGPSTGPKGKKRGAQRTPVRQKMKTMSRSLQMLNFARFSVKAQRSQAEPDSCGAARGTVKRSTRGTGGRNAAGAMNFKSEEELLSHLKPSYQQAVEDKSLPLLTLVQGLLSPVTAFMKSNTDAEAPFSDLIKKNLLKNAQSIRQIYGSAPDKTDSKIRDCQLQVVLRLELCKQSLSAHPDPDHMEHMVEEITDLLRIISLTSDPVYLSKFMKEEVLPLYLNGIPKVLADVYHSLGTQLPEELAAVLPPDIFSDDSVAKESVCVSPLSATQSLGSNVGDRLEELRNRSAKKRRTSMLTRHKSMTEPSQTLRQIEMPRKSSRQAKPAMGVPSEKLSVGSQPSKKQAVQEVTKVRRNLFNQETIMSPSKKGKMPRSQSVSAVEGLKKRKRSQMEDERRSLLTKKVSETPLHKQVSSRLLHRQKSGRRSGETDMIVVEESPVKPDLRRSPRIKGLARRHSSVFYSSSQSRSRNLDRALPSSQLAAFEDKGGIDINAVKSPMRLLFGAAGSPRCPSTFSRETRNNKEVQVGFAQSGFQTLNKTPRKSPYKSSDSAVGARSPQTPSSPSYRAKGPFFPKSPGSAVGENGMVLRGSPFRSPAPKSVVLETPKKSPLKGILRTPVKSLMEYDPISGPCLRSPNVRTPKKSVSWSPSQQTCLSEKTFKVPESPQSTNRRSPRLMTPSKYCTVQADVVKTHEKLPERKLGLSPETAHTGSEHKKIQRSANTKRTLSFPKKVDPQSTGMPYIEHILPPTVEIKTPKNSPGPSHTMCTRSGRTPPKCSRTPPHYNAEVLKSGSLLPSNVSLPIKDKLSQPFLRSEASGSHIFVSASCPSTSLNCSKFSQDLDGEPQITKAIERRNQSTCEISEEGSSSYSQMDSSCGTTAEESIDIAEASVVKTELTGGLKMNIAFSRKSSRPEVFEFTGTQTLSAETTQGCGYGFRQTPDRQQRRAAARLGSFPGQLAFSTPQDSGRPAQRKKTIEPNPLTYQVELEMQASGLPKLKFKRTDSFNLSEGPDCLAQNLTPLRNTRKSKVDSPLAHCSKHREPCCISPSLCKYGTPGKGSVQTHICQSITPTRLLPNSPSPLGPGEHVPWTPSPQKRGRSTPENFSRWPRKKRARTGMLGTKENGIRGECDVLDNPELDGVFRLRGEEEITESKGVPAFKHALSMRPGLLTAEEMDWTESVVPYDKKDAVKYERLSLKSGRESVGSAVTPPSSKVKKSVSVSGILALTQSPLLYKGKKGSVAKDTTQTEESIGNLELCSNERSMFMLDVSPFSQPRRRQQSSRTNSRKRLLDS